MCVFVLSFHSTELFGCGCFKHKTAYEMRSSDWSSDVCSSDLSPATPRPVLSWASILAGGGDAHRAPEPTRVGRDAIPGAAALPLRQPDLDEVKIGRAHV